jgi:hypothetical protein
MVIKRVLVAILIVVVMALFSASLLYIYNRILYSQVTNPTGPFDLFVYMGLGVTTITYLFHCAARAATYAYENYSLFKQSLCCGIVALLIFIIFISVVYEVTLGGLFAFTLCFVLNNSSIPFAEKLIQDRLN